jgi:hypothetical protein
MKSPITRWVEVDAMPRMLEKFFNQTATPDAFNHPLRRDSFQTEHLQMPFVQPEFLCEFSSSFSFASGGCLDQVEDK